MDRRNLNKFEQMGIIAVVMILALLFYSKKVYKPEVKRFVKLRKEWIEISSEVRTLKEDYGKQTLPTAIQQEKKNLQQAKLELDKVKNSAGYEKNLAGILTTVNQIAAKCNLKIKDFNPVDINERSLEAAKTTQEKEPFFKGNFYNLVITGNFTNLKGFLRELACMSKQVSIANIAIESEAENESLKITLLLSI